MPQFEPGNPGGPGRPKGSRSGRQLALSIIDEILADEGNAARLRAALQERFDRDPVKFWTDLGAPLVPTAARVALLPKPPDPLDPTRAMYLAAVAAVAEADRRRSEQARREGRETHAYGNVSG